MRCRCVPIGLASTHSRFIQASCMPHMTPDSLRNQDRRAHSPQHHHSSHRALWPTERCAGRTRNDFSPKAIVEATCTDSALSSAHALLGAIEYQQGNARAARTHFVAAY